MPFIFSAFLQIMWLSHPAWSHSAIIKSSLFLPFLCAWGLQFAHMVGRMIIAHVTSTRFPMWDWMWAWSLIGAVDANAQRLFGRPPLIQSTQEGASALVWLTLLVSAFAYGRFVTFVIQDITDYLGIACFKVKKRNEKGEWKDAKEVNKEMEMHKVK
jgi:ethanolaminephosphotransferase